MGCYFPRAGYVRACSGIFEVSGWDAKGIASRGRGVFGRVRACLGVSRRAQGYGVDTERDMALYRFWMYLEQDME